LAAVYDFSRRLAGGTRRSFSDWALFNIRNLRKAIR